MTEAEALRAWMDAYEQLFAELLELARNKQATLLKGSHHELQAVTAAEEGLLQRLSALERRGRELLGDGKAPWVRRDGRADRLREILGQLREVNEENTLLLRQMLGFVQFSLRLLEKASAGATYGAEGTVRSAQRGPVVDQRA